MYKETTKGISIYVQPKYEYSSSNPVLKRFIHSYQVKIENNGFEAVQLLRRYWLIVDGDGSKKEVNGEGVIGEQPIISPGKFHVYSSWSSLHFPMGKMEGYYQMENLITSEVFNVKIPPFTLVAEFKEN